MNAPESTLSRLALAAAAQGLRTLAPGQALALRPREPGELAIRRGAAWVTFDVPARGAPNGPLGDLYLPAGSRLALRPGQRLVLEPITPRGALASLPLVFDWLPAARPGPVRASAPRPTAAPGAGGAAPACA